MSRAATKWGSRLIKIGILVALVLAVMKVGCPYLQSRLEGIDLEGCRELAGSSTWVIRTSYGIYYTNDYPSARDDGCLVVGSGAYFATLESDLLDHCCTEEVVLEPAYRWSVAPRWTGSS